jgi:hypothetical protein
MERTTTMTTRMTKTAKEIEESLCDPECRGYAAFYTGREPHAGLEYPYDPTLEIQRCDACGKYETDEEAFQAWIEDGQPSLCAEAELEVRAEPPDDIGVHELLAQLAEKARGLGWDLPKLQDEVFAYFETVAEKT